MVGEPVRRTHDRATVASYKRAKERGATGMPVTSGVKGTVSEFTDAFNRSDAEAMVGLFAATDDVLGIGTDPTEWWHGPAALLPVLRAQLQEMADATFEVGETVGAANWLAAQCSISTPGAPAIPARLTMVCTSDGRIEHFHLSVGVANEDLLGQTLTT